MTGKKDNSLYALDKPSRCFGCDGKQEIDDIVKIVKKPDQSEVYCISCSNLPDFELLEKGNAKLTSLAKKFSKNHYVILKWSQLWKVFERQGILVEKSALLKARKELIEPGKN